MTNPNDTQAEDALKQVLPRFPKRWHKQLHRLGMDSFSNFVSNLGVVGDTGCVEQAIYTIKSGNTVMMARCNWSFRKKDDKSYLLCSVEVVHTRGSSAVPIDE